MSTKRFKTGFTLLELLITVAVVAILTSTVVVVGKRIRSQAEEKLARSTIGVLVMALEQYYEFWGKFPESPEPLDDVTTAEALYQQLWESTPTSRKICEQIRSLEIKDTDGNGEPELYVYDPWYDPILDNKLEYTYTLGDNFPLITSYGPDRKKDTVDDITSKGI